MEDNYMLRELHFVLYAIKKNIQSSAELRVSFIAAIVGMAINNSAFLILWIFFVQSVGVINNWTALDIVGLLGFSTLSFGIVFSFGAGLRDTTEYVTNGTFDRFLLSPKNVLIRIGTAKFGVSAVGDIFFGVVCLLVYGFLLHASLYQTILLFILVGVSSVLQFAMIVAIHAVSFFVTDGHGITHGLFDLFLTPSLFHGGAFQGGMRFFFTFLVPALLVGALPVEIVKNMSLGQLGVVFAVTVVWFFLSIALFHLGMKRYESSNFMTFGS